ncbi:high mobility group B protein 1-like isoform X3 [Phalaenopsis equestris]|uniref:high mobility group B protein 1-like isoform X3 n=1 Tax=Phalaenopsis equestris TaxID=78828 RepID=UPI0009E4E049|nr:high mobility group B protein 1-like isoform X3 [Phalaenopsis equestris]
MKGGKGGRATTKKETPEVLKPSDVRLGKRKTATKAEKSRKPKKDKKPKKDPNKPKRPPSAFFVFLEIYKREHPSVKAVSVVGKAGGEKWKSLTRAEKAPYEDKAAKRKSEYEKQMSAYNKKQESNADEGDEESDRSKSEVHDEDDDEESGEEEEDEEDDD